MYVTFYIGKIIDDVLRNEALFILVTNILWGMWGLNPAPAEYEMC